VVARGLVATVEVSPGAAGRNTMTVSLSDAAGKPLAPLEVTASLSNPAAGIEPLEREMTQAGDGLFRHEGPEFAVAGGWTVRIDALIGDFDKAVFTATLPIR
jgi:copper transport protein